jgi:hypothetical protein
MQAASLLTMRNGQPAHTFCVCHQPGARQWLPVFEAVVALAMRSGYLREAVPEGERFTHVL